MAGLDSILIAAAGSDSSPGAIDQRLAIRATAFTSLSNMFNSSGSGSSYGTLLSSLMLQVLTIVADAN